MLVWRGDYLEFQVWVPHCSKKLFYFKGQLISEQIHAVLNFPKMQRNIARISALASNMGQIIILISDYL